MEIENLIIECTRKCNMACCHCLRGEARNKNMKKEHIDVLLKQCTSVGNVTFSGGEPSLNVEIITYFLEQCKSKNIDLCSFYIATNGIKITEEFVVTCLKLYSYCYDKEACSVQVSNDMYHAFENTYDTILLDGLSFFSRKFSEEQYSYQNGKSVLNEGRAREYVSTSRRVETSIIKTKEDFRNAAIYLNCNGKIINGCDWSYANQTKHVLCSVENLTTYFNSLIDEN